MFFTVLGIKREPSKRPKKADKVNPRPSGSQAHFAHYTKRQPAYSSQKDRRKAPSVSADLGWRMVEKLVPVNALSNNSLLSARR